MLTPLSNRQRGLTLIELMIGMVIGLLVVGIATQMYISTLGITKQTTAMTRLNQELRSTIDLISSDIKRAGYYSNAVAASNPYASIVSGGLPVKVFAYDGGTDNCVVLGYDNNIAAEHIYGYRFSPGSGEVEMLTVSSYASGSQADCSSSAFIVTGGWDVLTDSRTVSISDLSFSLSPSPAASWAESSSKVIDVTLSGTAVADPKVTKVLRESVRVRNEYTD